MKKIIGLGCSWAQGEGGYPSEVFDKYKGRVNLQMGKDTHLAEYEKENSWVNVLTRDYLTDYISVNLGIRGIGNRAAVKELYFAGDKVDWQNDSGIIVLLLSGFERLDFFTDRIDAHYKYNTAWPHEHDPPKLLWEAYRTELHNDKMICMEALATILEVQTFAERYNFQLIIGNAYNPFHVPKFMMENLGKRYTDLVNWNNYIHTEDDKNFVEKLVVLDDFLPNNKEGYWEFYQRMSSPGKYLTNCIHPTIDGYKVIAKTFYDEMVKRNYL